MERLTTRIATVVVLAAACAGAPAAGAAPGPDAADVATALPLVVIDTDERIVNEPKVGARMRIIDARRGLNRLERRPNGYAGRIGIEIRGNSSQAYPKKQYAIETRERDGESRDVALLGMPEDDDWILQGPYGDTTLLRNRLAYATARAIGASAVRTRLVEAVVNGDYRGVFLLMERPELGRNRVAAGRRGHLLEMIGPTRLRPGDTAFPTATGRGLVLVDPDADDAGGAVIVRIREQIAAFEAALHGPVSADVTAGWRAHLDERSAVDAVLLQELFKNQDAFRSSLYVHGRADGRLRLGPLWDMDIAMGNGGDPATAAPEGWITQDRPWAASLWADRGFRRALADRWSALRADGLEERLMRRIDRDLRELGGATRRNFARWPVRGTVVWPSPAARGSHRAEVAHLRGWFGARIRWIDADVEGWRL